MYNLFWRSPALPYVQKQTAITVPAGAVVSNATSLRLTGKGATNYGKIQQENLLRLLENFASDAVPPEYPTVGQTWFDVSTKTLKVCTDTNMLPAHWAQLNSAQITGPGEPPPTSPSLGDTWFSQTGSASGILYSYTGIGRYPQVDWNASTSGYWPTPATTELRAIMNAQTFGAAGTNYGEAYIHGSTGGVAANVPGSILVDGVTTTVPTGYVGTRYPVTDGLIVVDPTGTMVPGAGTPAYFAARRMDDGRWFYDNNAKLIEFTPVNAMYAIGVITTPEQDDDTAPGITSITMWSSARRMTDITQAAGTVAGSGIGGWEQIWPPVETVAGRLEYEYMYGQLARLIGDPIIFGGSAAEGKSIKYLTNFGALDASMQHAYMSITPTDTSVLMSTLNSLKVAPNSQDWDALLSACRYAVNRLELPAGTVADVAVYPFVQDGRPGNQLVQGFTSSDVRALPDARKVQTRTGVLTLMSQYQETSNVLRNAIKNRYMLRGAIANSGVGTALPTVSTINQATYAASAASFTGTVTTGLAYEFSNITPNLEAFFYSGGVVELLMAHVPSGSQTAADYSLKALATTVGRIRISADATYVMSSSPTPTLAQAPGSSGFNQFTLGGTVLATLTSGGSTVVIRGVRESDFLVSILVDITAGGGVTGTFSIGWKYLYDGETYANPSLMPVYTPPVTATLAHRRGSTLFASV